MNEKDAVNSGRRRHSLVGRLIRSIVDRTGICEASEVQLSMETKISARGCRSVSGDRAVAASL